MRRCIETELKSAVQNCFVKERQGKAEMCNDLRWQGADETRSAKEEL